MRFEEKLENQAGYPDLQQNAFWREGGGGGRQQQQRQATEQRR